MTNLLSNKIQTINNFPDDTRINADCAARPLFYFVLKYHILKKIHSLQSMTHLIEIKNFNLFFEGLERIVFTLMWKHESSEILIGWKALINYSNSWCG